MERMSLRLSSATHANRRAMATAGLMALWLAGNVADLMTTRQGLRMGLREMNPVFSRLSWRKMVALKSVMAIGLGLAFLREPRVLRQVTAGQWAVVGWNGLMLARARHKANTRRRIM